MSSEPLLRIDTVAEALQYGDEWRVAYERECAAHAETLRRLEIERMLADSFETWWKQQQD
jgi:hypothetical protein